MSSEPLVKKHVKCISHNTHVCSLELIDIEREIMELYQRIEILEKQRIEILDTAYNSSASTNVCSYIL